MLGDILSRAPLASLHVLEVLKMDLDEILRSYEDNKFYRDVLKRINGKYVPEEMVRNKIDKFLPLFHYEDDKSMYQGKLFLPIKAICRAMQLATDAITAGHFGYIKTLEITKIDCRHKSRDVKNYIQGC